MEIYDKIESIYYRLKDRLREVRLFFINAWKFRKELSTFYKWDYNLHMLRRSIEITKDYIEKHGTEVEYSRIRKIEKMNRAIYLLDIFINDLHIEEAEKELNLKMVYKFYVEGNTLKDSLTEDDKKNNKLIRDMSNTLFTKNWDELFEILKGNKSSSYETHDGTGILNWWD